MLKEELKKSLDEAEWSWLKPHALRGSVILVESQLDILEVGHQVVLNNSHQINEWIQKGSLRKPTLEEIQAWDQLGTQRFLSLIVQPYVLVQVVDLH